MFAFTRTRFLIGSFQLPGILLAVVCYSASIHAAWLEASSDHFLIYANDSEKDIRAISEKLERYRSAMKYIFPTNVSKPSPSNRVTIYVVGKKQQVRKLFNNPNDARYVSGFYRPMAGGSLAIIPELNSSRGGKPTESELILLHEYAHHYLLESASYMVPRWFSEGFAEYFSSARFDKDGSVGLGLPSEIRSYDLEYAIKVSLEELLDARLYAARESKRYDNFHARSWLLFHYMYSENGRRQKLLDYLNRINKGEGELSSAIGAFGDLEALEDSLSSYRRQRKLTYLQVTPKAMVPVNITIRELNEAEAAAMPIRIRSKTGVDDQEAAEVVVDARAVAEKYPDDPEVLASLTEAEYDAGNDTAAIAAADRALAGNPANMTALVQKGYALTRIAKQSQYPQDWELARKHFVSINKIENDHPIPLIFYYLSFIEKGEEPTETAKQGIEWALKLAPYDNSLRMLVAEHLMKEKRYQDVIITLNPLAYNPHAGDDNQALAMIEQAKKELGASSTVDGK